MLLIIQKEMLILWIIPIIGDDIPIIGDDIPIIGDDIAKPFPNMEMQII